MNKYKLCFEDKNSKFELISFNKIIELDDFTSNFNDEEDILNYFNILEYDTFNLYIQSNSLKLPIVYLKHKENINNIDLLKDSLLEKSDDFNFLYDFLKYYLKGNYNIKSNIKKIRKSLKNIDTYTSSIISLSNSIRVNYNNIIRNNNSLSKKYTYSENIGYEKNNIEENLQGIFYHIVYDNDKINYLNLRELCLFLDNYDIKNLDNKSLVKRKNKNK